MNKKDWIASIMTGLILGGLLALSGLYSSAVAQKGTLAPDSPFNQIIPLVLNSHNHWKTLQGDAEVTWYGPGGETQTYFMNVEISQPNKGYIESFSEEGNGNDGIWISNGDKVYELKRENETYTEGNIPTFAKDLSKLPLSLEAINRDTPMPHPFAMFISAPVRDLIFPTEFIQSSPVSSFNLKGQETFLGREVWVVTKQDPSGDLSTVWIDKATGIFLKYERYLSGQKWMELFFTSVEINRPIDSFRFELPAGYQPVILP